MDIGKLNRRVEILEFKKVRDSYGGEDGRWEVASEVWANIKPVSGTEYFTMQQVEAQVVVTITMRYNPNVNVMNRIRYLGKTFEIIGVSDEGAEHKVTILNCKELTNIELQSKAKEKKRER